MTAFGLLIDYEYCSGCQSCEVSCKEEHGYPVGKWGIRVMDDGPWEIEPGRMNWNKAYEARGAFVSARKDDASRRRAAAMEVDANAQVEFATHRDDSDVRNVEELNEQ